MRRSITLTADPKLIEEARDAARRRNTTLNEAFRHWLARYARQEEAGAGYDELMGQLSYARAGRSFQRDELNER
ncbi:MAG: hypothetical protein ACYDA8_05675 [Deferrisomatales bacterium]